METIQITGTVQELGARYAELINCWNNTDAEGFAALFTADADVVGFDGSQMKGSQDIRKQLDEIFSSHKVSSYVTIVREIRQLSSTIFLLRAVAGMVPPGTKEINPKVNAIQTLVAQKENEVFKIIIFQNTPAAFHGRPELSEQLTTELQQKLNEGK